jgi:hypothetical protein
MWEAIFALAVIFAIGLLFDILVNGLRGAGRLFRDSFK